MALDPNKKKPLEKGTQIGNLTLVPGSGLDSAIKAIGAHQSNVTNTLAQAGRANQLQPRFITADSGQMPDSVKKAPLALPQPQVTPPNGGLAPLAVPARSPASPATTAGASAPAGGGAAPLPRFNTITNDGAGAQFTTGDGRTAALPAGVSVTRQKNGVNAFGATGASVAAATGQPQNVGAPLALPTAPAQVQPNLSVNLPRPATADPYNIRQNDEQRRALLSSLDSQAFAAGLAQPSRGQRSALGDIRNAQASLINEGGRLAGDIASGDRNVVGANDLAGINQTSENQRALLQDNGATTRTGMQEAGANQRVQLQSLAELNKPTQITDTEGNLLQVTGGAGTFVLGPDGKPVRPAQTKAEGAITPAVALSSATEELKALLANPPLSADPNYDAQVTAARNTVSQLRAGNSGSAAAPSEPPAAAIARLKANPQAAAQFDEVFGKGASARYLTR